MALTIRQLNGDASFLLVFEPIAKFVPGITAEPMRILMDPWMQGATSESTTHQESACISSLGDVPEPDLVIISQHKSDHCHEATLRQLPANGSRTLILAEPTAARKIRSWKYFHKERVRTIPKWEDARTTGRPGVIRIHVPPIVPDGQPGEVTVAFIPQERDATKLHGAIGITYRPPPLGFLAVRPTSRAFAVPVLTPPTSPGLPLSSTSPLRSVQSASTLCSSNSVSGMRVVAYERPLSVIFSPHGINYSSLHSYATSHLIAEAALPLTALLHCFHSETNPWWLGGNVCLGAPVGTETAARLGARVWISAHDADKVVKGLPKCLQRTRRKFALNEVLDGLNDTVMNLTQVRPPKLLLRGKTTPGNGPSDTEVISLSAGEDVFLSSTGLIRDTVDREEEPFRPGDGEVSPISPLSVHVSSPAEEKRLCDEDKETNYYPHDKHPAFRPETPPRAVAHALHPVGAELSTPPMTPVPEECLV